MINPAKNLQIYMTILTEKLEKERCTYDYFWYVFTHVFIENNYFW